MSYLFELLYYCCRMLCWMCFLSRLWALWVSFMTVNIVATIVSFLQLFGELSIPFASRLPRKASPFLQWNLSALLYWWWWRWVPRILWNGLSSRHPHRRLVLRHRPDNYFSRVPTNQPSYPHTLSTGLALATSGASSKSTVKKRGQVKQLNTTCHHYSLSFLLVT